MRDLRSVNNFRSLNFSRSMKIITLLAELVDALDLGSSILRCSGSSPEWSTIHSSPLVQGIERKFPKL